MDQLTRKKCVPCEGKTQALTKSEADQLLVQIPGWTLHPDGKSIERHYDQLVNFVQAVRFINQITDVAESENHHPDLHLTDYRQLRVVLSTHAIRGLSENDFIVAAKIDAIENKGAKN